MRKRTLLALFMICGLVLATASFAEVPKKEPPQKHNLSQLIRGTITAVDAAGKKITVKPDGDKPAVTISADDVSSLKEGQRVKVILKDGTTDQAESVKVIIHKNKK